MHLYLLKRSYVLVHAACKYYEVTQMCNKSVLTFRSQHILCYVSDYVMEWPDLYHGSAKNEPLQKQLLRGWQSPVKGPIPLFFPPFLAAMHVFDQSLERLCLGGNGCYPCQSSELWGSEIRDIKASLGWGWIFRWSLPLYFDRVSLILPTPSSSTLPKKIWMSYDKFPSLAA